MRAPRGRGRLVVRTTVGHAGAVDVQIDGKPSAAGAFAGERVDRALDRPPGEPGAEMELALTPVGGDWLDCHLWILDGRD